MPLIKKICEYCKKEFFVYPYREKTAKFCSKKCGCLSKTGEKHNAFKNGRIKIKLGYIMIRINKKYIYEHRFIMEKHINRKLKKFEVVHHKNGDKTDNRIENLIILNKKEHDKYETKKRWEKNSKSFNTIKTHTKEAKIKIGKANKGKKHSQETKDKIRNTLLKINKLKAKW